MRKSLLAVLIVIPFFWTPSELKSHTKAPAHPQVNAWNLPDAVKKFVTTSTVYRAVESWMEKLWPF